MQDHNKSRNGVTHNPNNSQLVPSSNRACGGAGVRAGRSAHEGAPEVAGETHCQRYPERQTPTQINTNSDNKTEQTNKSEYRSRKTRRRKRGRGGKNVSQKKHFFHLFN